MRLSFNLIFCIMLISMPAFAEEDVSNCLNNFHPTASKNMLYLKEWEGKYPNYDNPNKKEFFKLPEIRKPLAKLLDKKDFYLLTKRYGCEVPIQVIDNYLIVERCKPHECPGENALFILNLENGSMNVAFFAQYENKTVTRWINSNEDNYELPEEINTILHYRHTPYMGFIPQNKMPIKYYIDEGKYCIDKDDYKQALLFFNEGLKYYPNSVRLYNLKSYTLNKLGKSAEAFDEIKKSLVLKPDF